MTNERARYRRLQEPRQSDLPGQSEYVWRQTAYRDPLPETKDVASVIAPNSPVWQISSAQLRSERRRQPHNVTDAQDQGPEPEQALPKIVEGRVTGFFKDSVLLEQAYVRENKKSVKQILDDAGVTVEKFVRFQVGQG